MLFDRFENEAAFRADFVRPLLTRLGFVSVAELHGTQEFGKDFGVVVRSCILLFAGH